MKDHDWSWTLFGAALVSLESLDMIFDVWNAKIWPIEPNQTETRVPNI